MFSPCLSETLFRRVPHDLVPRFRGATRSANQMPDHWSGSHVRSGGPQYILGSGVWGMGKLGNQADGVESALSMGPMFPLFAAEFQLDDTKLSLLIGACVLALGFSNFLIVPCSNIFSRRLASMVFCLLGIASCIWQAKIKQLRTSMDTSRRHLDTSSSEHLLGGNSRFEELKYTASEFPFRYLSNRLALGWHQSHNARYR